MSRNYMALKLHIVNRTLMEITNQRRETPPTLLEPPDGQS
jgi:hypothetical protein